MGLAIVLARFRGSGEQNRRDRRAILTTVAGISYRLSDACLKVVIIPIAARLLGLEKYGIWLTANSLLSLLMVSDFGVGTGMINAVSGARAQGDDQSVRSLTATAYIIFGVLALTLLAGVTALAHTTLLGHWLGVQGKPSLEAPARHLFLLLGIFVASAAFLNVINYFALALQEGYLEYIAQIAASLTSLILILNLRSHSMSRFAEVSSLPIIGAFILLSIGLFGFRYRSLVPNFRGVSMVHFRLIWKDSSRLLIAQIADTVIAFTSNILVASRLGSSRVPEVSVSLQVMMICSFVACMFILPLWPAYVEAGVREDWSWIRSAFSRGVIGSMGSVLLATTVYTLIYRVFIHIWSPILPIPPLLFVLLLDVWFLLYVWNKNPMVLLNGMGHTKVRAWAAPISAVVFVFTVHLLLPRVGVVAVPIGGIASALVEASITTTRSFLLLSWKGPVVPGAIEVPNAPEL